MGTLAFDVGRRSEGADLFPCEKEVLLRLPFFPLHVHFANV